MFATAYGFEEILYFLYIIGGLGGIVMLVRCLWSIFRWFYDLRRDIDSLKERVEKLERRIVKLEEVCTKHGKMRDPKRRKTGKSIIRYLLALGIGFYVFLNFAAAIYAKNIVASLFLVTCGFAGIGSLFYYFRGEREKALTLLFIAALPYILILIALTVGIVIKP